MMPMRRMQHPNLPIQSIEDLRLKWDWSKIKVQLVASFAGKHEGWPRVVQFVQIIIYLNTLL
jgi:hypothetical protein